MATASITIAETPLLNYALHALDEAQKWLGKQSAERTQPVMALVEVANTPVSP